MNYHFIIDDKFIDPFIEEANNQAPGENIFLINSSGKHKYVRSENIEYFDFTDDRISFFLNILNVEDKIIVHWLHKDIEKLILLIPQEILVFAVFWSGDFIQDPADLYVKKYHENLTLKYIKNKKILNCLHQIFSPKNLVELLFFQFKVRKRFKLKKLAIRRIDFVLHWNLFDLDEINEIFGIKKNMIFFFYGNYHMSYSGLSNLKIENKRKILIGNSATTTNNHIDIFDKLRNLKNLNFEFYCPLSYGNKEYAQFVIKRGRIIFKEKFIAINDFLTFSEYNKILSNMDIAIFNNIRSQAAANIFTAVQYRNMIFLNSRSSIFKLFNFLGIEVGSTNDLNLNNTHILEPLEHSILNKNAILLEEYLNYDFKMKNLKFILTHNFEEINNHFVNCNIE